MMTDPIADLLTRIRNALVAGHESVQAPASKTKIAIARVLRKEGFIRNFEVVRDGVKRTIRIDLAYSGRKEPTISGLRRVSKPGLRVYVQKREIPRVYSGLGIAILTTPQGVMTGQEAWRRQVGGEVLCYVW
ncbi:MAG: 30S ribosomal protein S8 [Dehalococcoidia bacterium]|jgi:small subunit ribosomal protein S8|nr:30S ribosomal protein S8 [Dehalococcoidia bacterium]